MKNKKIKVCFISPFAYGLFNPKCNLKFGGAEVQMYLIAKEISKDKRFKINFIVLDIGQKNKEKYKNISIYKAYKRGRNILNLLKAPITLFFVLVKTKPEIIIGRASGVEIGISLFYSKLFNKKFIYSIACDKDVNKTLFKGIRGKIFKYGFEKADYYIAQSKQQLLILQNTYKKQFLNLTIIHNSYNLHKNIDNFQKNIILWVGSSLPLKQPEIFVDLAKSFPQEDFVMIMTKSSTNLDNWNKIKQETEKLKNLKLISHVPFKHINKYFNKAKVFINTSTVEGFPNTFLQAMMNKTPILSLKVDPDNFIRNNQCGFICDNNYNEMKKRLKILLQNKKQGFIMGENGYKYLDKNHNIKNNIKKWKKVILSMQK